MKGDPECILFWATLVTIHPRTLKMSTLVDIAGNQSAANRILDKMGNKVYEEGHGNRCRLGLSDQEVEKLRKEGKL